MLFDVLYASTLVTKSFRRSISAQTFDKWLCCSCYVPWKVHHVDSFQDNVVCLHWVCCCKWRPKTANKLLNLFSFQTNITSYIWNTLYAINLESNQNNLKEPIIFYVHSSNDHTNFKILMLEYARMKHNL